MSSREHLWLSASARTLALAFLTLTLFVLPAGASVPPLMNYQGCLADGNGNVRTGSFRMTFRLFSNSTSGTLLWSESYAGVSVNRGVFSVLLGSANPIPASLFSGDSLWLETAVNDTALAPRRMISSVGYAFRSGIADSAIAAPSPRIVSGTICANGGVCGGSGFTANLIPAGSGGVSMSSVALSNNVLSAPGIGSFLSSLLSGPERTVMITCNGTSQFYQLLATYGPDQAGLGSAPPACGSATVTKDMAIYDTFVVTYAVPFSDTPHVFATWSSNQSQGSLLRVPIVTDLGSSTFRSQCSITMYYGPMLPTLPPTGGAVDFMAIGR